MIRRIVRIALVLSLLGGLAYVLAKRRPSSSAVAPATPVAAPPAAWVEPTGGMCPTSHPVKAKLASKIFHVPGGANYERTNPDRCYLDADQAEADGLRAAKR